MFCLPESHSLPLAYLDKCSHKIKPTPPLSAQMKGALITSAAASSKETQQGELWEGVGCWLCLLVFLISLCFMPGSLYNPPPHNHHHHHSFVCLLFGAERVVTVRHFSLTTASSCGLEIRLMRPQLLTGKKNRGSNMWLHYMQPLSHYSFDPFFIKKL